MIDSQLALSGWNVNDPTQVIEEFDNPTPLPDGVAEPHTPSEGYQFSDYLLLGKVRKPLAVVEAKKSSKPNRQPKIGCSSMPGKLFLQFQHKDATGMIPIRRNDKKDT